MVPLSSMACRVRAPTVPLYSAAGTKRSLVPELSTSALPAETVPIFDQVAPESREYYHIPCDVLDASALIATPVRLSLSTSL